MYVQTRLSRPTGPTACLGASGSLLISSCQPCRKGSDWTPHDLIDSCVHRSSGGEMRTTSVISPPRTGVILGTGQGSIIARRKPRAPSSRAVRLNRIFAQLPCFVLPQGLQLNHWPCGSSTPVPQSFLAEALPTGSSGGHDVVIGHPSSTSSCRGNVISTDGCGVQIIIQLGWWPFAPPPRVWGSLIILDNPAMSKLSALHWH